MAFNLALRHIDAYLLMVIETSSMVLGLAIDRLLRTPVKVSRWGLAVGCVGIGLLSVDALRSASTVVWVGLFFAALTALTFALFNCTLRYLTSKSDALLPLMLPIVLVCLPMAWGEMARRPDVPWRDMLLAIAVVGVIQTGVVYILWARASAHFVGSVLCQISMLTIPLTFLLEYLFLDLTVNLLQIAASGALAVAVLANVRQRQSSPAENDAAERHEIRAGDSGTLSARVER